MINYNNIIKDYDEKNLFGAIYILYSFNTYLNNKFSLSYFVSKMTLEEFENFVDLGWNYYFSSKNKIFYYFLKKFGIDIKNNNIKINENYKDWDNKEEPYKITKEIINKMKSVTSNFDYNIIYNIILNEY